MKKHELIFATHNPNKVQEVRAMLPDWVELHSLEDMKYADPIPEKGLTLEQNARNKAYTVYKFYNMTDCFADDTGLEVEALHGAPGVHTARFAGENANAEQNMQLLLEKLRGQENRRAVFKTVFCLIYDGLQWIFEGEVPGQILEAPRGSGGFGYDPVFQPEGYNTSFAEMGPEEKNRISHRAIALNKMINFMVKRHDNILSFASGKKEFLLPIDKLRQQQKLEG